MFPHMAVLNIGAEKDFIRFWGDF